MTSKSSPTLNGVTAVDLVVALVAVDSMVVAEAEEEEVVVEEVEGDVDAEDTTADTKAVTIKMTGEEVVGVVDTMMTEVLLCQTLFEFIVEMARRVSTICCVQFDSQ